MHVTQVNATKNTFSEQPTLENDSKSQSYFRTDNTTKTTSQENTTEINYFPNTEENQPNKKMPGDPNESRKIKKSRTPSTKALDFNISKIINSINDELKTLKIPPIEDKFFSSINGSNKYYTLTFTDKIVELSATVPNKNSQIVEYIKVMHSSEFEIKNISGVLYRTKHEVDKAIILLTTKNLYKVIKNKSNPHGILTTTLANNLIKYLLQNPNEQDSYINYLITLQNQISEVFSKLNLLKSTVTKQKFLEITLPLNSFIDRINKFFHNSNIDSNGFIDQYKDLLTQLTNICSSLPEGTAYSTSPLQSYTKSADASSNNISIPPEFNSANLNSSNFMTVPHTQNHSNHSHTQTNEVPGFNNSINDKLQQPHDVVDLTLDSTSDSISSNSSLTSSSNNIPFTPTLDDKNTFRNLPYMVEQANNTPNGSSNQTNGKRFNDSTISSTSKKLRNTQNFNINTIVDGINTELKNLNLNIQIEENFFSGINGGSKNYSQNFLSTINDLSEIVPGKSSILARCLEIMNFLKFTPKNISGMLNGVGIHIDKAITILTQQNIIDGLKKLIKGHNGKAGIFTSSNISNIFHGVWDNIDEADKAITIFTEQETIDVLYKFIYYEDGKPAIFAPQNFSTILIAQRANIDKILRLFKNENIYNLTRSSYNPYAILTATMTYCLILFLIKQSDSEQNLYIDNLINLQNKFTKILLKDAVCPENILLNIQNLNNVINGFQYKTNSPLLKIILSNYLTLSNQLAETCNNSIQTQNRNNTPINASFTYETPDLNIDELTFNNALTELGLDNEGFSHIFGALGSLPDELLSNKSGNQLNGLDIEVRDQEPDSNFDFDRDFDLESL